MLERHESRVHSYAFDSLTELGEYIVSAPKTWRGNASKNNEKQKLWDLNAGYAACVDMAINGWNEGAQRAQEVLKQLALRDAAPVLKNDFYGHMPHVPRFCAGAPDSMLRHSRDGVSGSRQVLTIYVPVNALADVSANCMANFGLGVAQYINQMEQLGHRVEVHGLIKSKVSGHTVTHTWLIKRAQQLLDLAVLSFAIGHPGMFRRLGFALRERCAAPEDYGYGRPERAKLEDIINPPNGAYILNGMVDANTIASTPQAAYEYISKQLDKMFHVSDAD